MTNTEGLFGVVPGVFTVHTLFSCVSNRSASTVTEASHGQIFHRLPRFAPYLFHNVSNGLLKRGGLGSTASTSLSNPVEVAYITALLK